MQFNYLELVKTGIFFGAKPGDNAEKLLKLLPEPDSGEPDGGHAIFSYGSIDIAFIKTNEKDYWHFWFLMHKFKSGLPNQSPIVSDYWVFKKGLLREEFLKYCEEENIEIIKKYESPTIKRISYEVKPGLFVSFITEKTQRDEAGLYEISYVWEIKPNKANQL